MLAAINDRREIAFEFVTDPDSNWLRAYMMNRANSNMARVAFDRAGLCYLDAENCRELAAWLLARAEEMVQQPPAPQKKPKRRRFGFHLDKHVEIGKHD
jgi:hypothetical protein